MSHCYVCYVFFIQSSELIKIVYKKSINIDWLMLTLTLGDQIWFFVAVAVAVIATFSDEV